MFISSEALAQAISKEECRAIIQSGTPIKAVKYCIGLFPDISYPSSTGGSTSGGGSSTQKEKEKTYSIIKSSNGELYSIQKFTAPNKTAKDINWDTLRRTDISAIDKFDLQIQNGELSRIK